MKWKRETFCACATCEQYNLRINEFGICADCWATFSDAERAAVLGGAVEAARVVTYSIPAQPGVFRRFVSSAVGTVVGMTGAIGLAHWLGWC